MFIYDSGKQILSKELTDRRIGRSTVISCSIGRIPSFAYIEGFQIKQAFSYTLEHLGEDGVWYFCRETHAKYNTGEKQSRHVSLKSQ